MALIEPLWWVTRCPGVWGRVSSDFGFRRSSLHYRKLRYNILYCILNVKCEHQNAATHLTSPHCFQQLTHRLPPCNECHTLGNYDMPLQQFTSRCIISPYIRYLTCRYIILHYITPHTSHYITLYHILVFHIALYCIISCLYFIILHTSHYPTSHCITYIALCTSHYVTSQCATLPYNALYHIA